MCVPLRRGHIALPSPPAPLPAFDYHVDRLILSASHGRCAGRRGPIPCARRQRSLRKRLRSRRSAGVIMHLYLEVACEWLWHVPHGWPAAAYCPAYLGFTVQSRGTPKILNPDIAAWGIVLESEGGKPNGNRSERQRCTTALECFCLCWSLLQFFGRAKHALFLVSSVFRRAGGHWVPGRRND